MLTSGVGDGKTGKQGKVGGSIARPIAHYTSRLLRSVRAKPSFAWCPRPLPVEPAGRDKYRRRGRRGEASADYGTAGSPLGGVA